MMLTYLKFLPLLHALNTGGSAETYRIVIAYPKKKIHTIKHTGVFHIDNAGFIRLSHI